MNKGKTKLTRQDAERLFEGLPATTSRASSSRAENPFGDAPSTTPKHAPFAQDDEAKLWKDNLITLPKAFELPSAYASVERLREALVKAWRVKWIRETGSEIVTEFPEGWTAVRPASGPIQLRDPSGVVRAMYGWAKDAEVRILPRYMLEPQANSSSGLGSVLVRDRGNGQILERSSNWSANTGTNHPDWGRLSTWLNARYPDHRDPLRYWDDCEANQAASSA